MNKSTLVAFGFISIAGILGLLFLKIGTKEIEIQSSDKIESIDTIINEEVLIVAEESKVENEQKKQVLAELDFEVSFEIVEVGEHRTLCYTNDPDSLWNYIPWAIEIRSKMLNLNTTSAYLFNSKENTPGINTSRSDLESEYEQFKVCQFITFTNGNTQFCFGGKKEDGRWVDCRTKKGSLPDSQ